MKKLVIIILCKICISLGAFGQQTLRIGKMEFIRHHSQDTTVQVIVEDAPRITPVPEYRYKNRYSGVFNLGLIFPDYNHSYKTSNIASINFDLGAMHSHQISRRFSTGATSHYSYYNYRMRDANIEYNFRNLVMNGTYVERVNIKKQVFRSHNLAHGLFLRYYFMPPTHRRDPGVYIDMGIQGDWAFSKYYKMKTHNGQKKYRNGDVFNPVTASFFAKFGWNQNNKMGLGSGNINSSNDFRAIYVRYRFTNAFRDVLPIDLPPITIGLVFISDIAF